MSIWRLVHFLANSLQWYRLEGFLDPVALDLPELTVEERVIWDNFLKYHREQVVQSKSGDTEKNPHWFKIWIQRELKSIQTDLEAYTEACGGDVWDSIWERHCRI